MLDRFKNMLNGKEDFGSIEDGSDKIGSKATLSGIHEEEVEELLNIFRATRLPLKTYYYERAKKQYVILSHVFHKKDMAESFMMDLKEALPSCKVGLKEDLDGRSLVYLLPRTLEENEFSRFMKNYSAKLFQTAESFHDPKNKVQAKYVLDALRTTSVPMDLYYWNYENNVYYICSHVFHDYRRVERYKERFEKNFGKHSVDVMEDVSGRFIINLNPAALEKTKFKEFVNNYRISLFEEHPKHNEYQGDGFFEATLDESQYMLNSLRNTTFPFDSIFFDKTYDMYYLVSHVFYNEERANHFMDSIKEYYDDYCVVGRSDEEGRWFVYLNPNYIKKSLFKEFCKLHRQES